MKESYMRFGEYIWAKRLANPREVTLKDVSKVIGISLNYLSEMKLSGNGLPLLALKQS